MSNFKEKYQRKIGNFYNFKISNEQFGVLNNKVKSVMFKNFKNAIIFGFLIETLFLQTKICKK